MLGWWDNARDTRDRRLPFSLVVSVDLGEVDVDLYAAVSAALEAVIEM